MKSWKTIALSAALLGATGLGVWLSPAAHAQSRTPRATAAPRAEVFGFGSGGRIGVTIRDLDTDDAKGKTATGVVIESVDENSPAAKAGLKTGDIIVEFDGERVRSVRQFTRLVSETPEGRSVSAAAMRDGQRVTVNVTPESSSAFRFYEGQRWSEPFEALRVLPSVPPRTVTPAPLPPSLERFVWRSGNQLGVTLTELSDQLSDYFGTKDGVLVSSVRADSAAAKAGVKAGDVISSVNGSTVSDAEDVRRAIRDLKDDQEFTLGIVRDKRTMTVKGKIERPAPPRRTTRTVL